MANKLEAPGGPWQRGVVEFTDDYTVSGRSNIGWGTIDTQHQRMSGSLRMYAYKLRKAENVPNDYYAVYGHMSHGVQHGTGRYDPGPNWVSVGYYVDNMSLVLELLDARGRVWDVGPTSTVGTSTTSFNIGGNLGAMVGDISAVTGGVSASFGASYSSPAVTISEATVGLSARWDLRLPGVGFQSPGVPANPKEPSYGGYTWYYGVIYELPEGDTLKVRVHPKITWRFDYTRGIQNDSKTYERDLMFTFNPPA